MTTVNLEDYGLTYETDGVYADAALEAALAESAARQTATPLGTFFGGLRIRVNGLYKLAGTRERALPMNTYLEGGGRCTGFICHGDGLSIHDLPGTNSDTDSEITNMTLYSTQTDRVGVYSSGGSGCRISNVFFVAWEFGIDAVDPNCMVIERCAFGGSDTFGSALTTGVRFRGEANVNVIRDCRFNCWRGVDHVGGAANKILSSNFNNPQVGVYVRGATGLHIEGNYEATTVAGVLVDNPGNVAAINLTLSGIFHGGGGGANSSPMMKVTSASAIYGLNILGCHKQGGVHMVEHDSGLDISGAFIIGNRHYGSGTLFDRDVVAHESTFYASSAYYTSDRSFIGVGTVLPQKTLEVFDGPVGLRLRDGSGVRLDLP